MKKERRKKEYDKKADNKKVKIAIIILFVIYCALMIILLLGRPMAAARDISFIPFATTQKFFKMIGKGDPAGIAVALMNLLGNIIMFVPAGYMMPCIFRTQRKFWVFILTFAGIIIVMETLQYFTARGTADIDDLIFNLAGGTAGFYLGKLLKFF